MHAFLVAGNGVRGVAGMGLASLLQAAVRALSPVRALARSSRSRMPTLLSRLSHARPIARPHARTPALSRAHTV